MKNIGEKSREITVEPVTKGGRSERPRLGEQHRSWVALRSRPRLVVSSWTGVEVSGWNR